MAGRARASSAGAASSKVADRFAAMLIFTLNNPMDPRASCIMALAVAGVQMVAWDCDPPGLARAAMTFLACERSETEFNALKEYMSSCHCSRQDSYFAFLHNPSNAHMQPSPPPDLLFGITASVLSNAIEVFLFRTPGKYRKKKKDAPLLVQPWPQSLSDIFPESRSHVSVLQALDRWTAFPHGAAMYSVFTSLARFCEPFAQEVFRESILIESTVATLERAVSCYLDNDLRLFTQTMRTSVDFLQNLQILDRVELRKALHPVSPRIEAVAARAVPVLREIGGMEQTIMTLELYADSVTPNMHKKWDPRLFVDLGFPIAMRMTGVTGNMLALRQRDRCMNLSCVGVGRSSSCGRCGCIRYCSKECQKQAWTAAQCPHKPLCAAISSFRAATDAQDDAEWGHILSGGAPFGAFLTRCAQISFDSSHIQTLEIGLHELIIAKAEGPGRDDQPV